jgi:non-ribosomal peptide synthetase component F/acyl carrier protein
MKALNKKNIEDILALTTMQEGMLYHYLKDSDSEHYFEQICLEISGEINGDFFEKAWNSVIETNEMLRTVFRWEKVENPIQIILKEHRLQPGYFNLSGRDTVEKKKVLEEIKEKDRKNKFDLQEVPFRVTLGKLDEERYEMIISNHHILYDGWSNGIILKEFFNAYNNLSNGTGSVKPIKQKFREFVKWYQNRNLDKQEEFWKTYLEGLDEPTGPSIRIKKRERRNKIKSAGHYHRKLPGQVKDRLDVFVKKYKESLSSLLYCAWGILLQKYNSGNNVLFDITVSGRPPEIKGVEDIVGLFINTLPIRVQTHPDESVIEVLKKVSGDTRRFGEFGNRFSINLKELIDEYNFETSFDSVVVIENYPLDRRLIRESGPLRVDRFSISGMTAYDMTVIMTLFDDIHVNFSYNQELFNKETTALVSHHLISIMDEIVRNPRKNVSQLGEYIEKEKDKVLYRFKENQKNESGARKEYAAAPGTVEEKLVNIWSNLLHIEESAIGIDADFFEFGGHSLKAMVLLSKIDKEFKVKVPLIEVFKQPTIRELARYIKESNDKEGKFTFIEPTEKREYYSLSSAQRGIFTIQQMAPKSTAYNSTFVMMFIGELDRERLEKVFCELIRRHECLRTSFEWVGDEPMQRIHETGELDIKYYKTDEKDMGKILSDAVKPFNHEKLPLMRARLLNVTPQHYILLVDIHHIIADGASMGVLIDEFIALYEGKELAPLTIQYKDYSRWQKNKQEIERIKKQEEFWLERFKDYVRSPDMAVKPDFPGGLAVADKEGSVHFEIAPATTGKLRKLILETKTTLYTVFLAVYNILLLKYTKQEDIVIGTPIMGRRHPDLQNIIGMFVNMLAMRNFPRPHKTFAEFLHEVKEDSLNAFENQEYPFEELILRLQLERTSSRNPLVEVVFDLENIEFKHEGTLVLEKETIQWKLKPYEQENRVPKFDLELGASENRDRIRCFFKYRSRSFKKKSIRRIARHFTNIMEEIVENPGVRLSEIKMLNQEEKAKILKKTGFKRKKNKGIPMEVNRTVNENPTVEAEFDL